MTYKGTEADSEVIKRIQGQKMTVGIFFIMTVIFMVFDCKANRCCHGSQEILWPLLHRQVKKHEWVLGSKSLSRPSAPPKAGEVI